MPDDLIARLMSLEESLAFAERTIEHLSAEIALLNRHGAEDRARIQRLEARLEQLQSPPEEAPDGEPTA